MIQVHSSNEPSLALFARAYPLAWARKSGYAESTPSFHEAIADLTMRKRSARKPISRTVRFEVFKRDSFKCQYCGRAGPDVLLQIDHLKPIAEGGTNDLLNLITSCAECNGGKGKVPLSDSTAIEKQRLQLEQLQERREQLEMMMEWQRGLLSLHEDAVDSLATYWHERTPGFTVNANGRQNMRTWLRKFSMEELVHAMNVAAENYLKFKEDGTVTAESWELAFSKIPGICRVERASKDDPDLKELFYIRGIARNRCGYFNDHQAMDWLKAARSWDISLEWLRDVARRCRSWTNFWTTISDAIDEAEKLESARLRAEANTPNDSQREEPRTK